MTPFYLQSFLGEFLESQKGKLPGSIETESTNPEYLEPKPCRLQKSVPKNTFRYINEEERKYRNRLQTHSEEIRYSFALNSDRSDNLIDIFC